MSFNRFSTKSPNFFCCKIISRVSLLIIFVISEFVIETKPKLLNILYYKVIVKNSA